MNEPTNSLENAQNQVNPRRLPVIQRTIASALIFSKDGKLLMGRKDPSKGGVYPNAWHIPGGGIEDGETLDEAVIREVVQETGLDISNQLRKPVPIIGRGSTVKTLETGEKVWCEMGFNRFEVRMDQTAAELEQTAKPGDDLVELRWFNREELGEVELIPGGTEFFIQAGYMDPS